MERVCLSHNGQQCVYSISAQGDILPNNSPILWGKLGCTLLAYNEWENYFRVFARNFPEDCSCDAEDYGLLERLGKILYPLWDAQTPEHSKTTHLAFIRIIKRFANEIKEGKATEKEVITFINEEKTFRWWKFKNWKSHKTLLQNLPPHPEQHYSERVLHTAKKLVREYPKFITQIARMVRNGILADALETDANTLLSNYLSLCDATDKTPQTSNGWLHAYAELQRWLRMNKNEILNSHIKKNQPQNLCFENNEFCVVVPTTAEAIYKEGDNLHNCLRAYNYAEEVAYGRLHIVFIRKKSDPETPFIACEIDLDGTIEQYLAAFNEEPEESAQTFKGLYQQYLDSLNW